MSETVILQKGPPLSVPETLKPKAADLSQEPPQSVEMSNIQAAAQQTAVKMMVIGLSETVNLTLAASLKADIPRLALPTTPLNVEAKQPAGLSALVAGLMQIFADGNTHKLQNRLSQINALSLAKTASGLALLNEYIQANAESAQVIQEATADGDAFVTANKHYEGAKSDYEAAKDKLAGMNPSDIDYGKAQDSLNKATGKLSLASTALGIAKDKSIASASLATEKMLIVDGLWDKLQKQPNVDRVVLKTTNEQHLTGLAAMTLLLGTLSNLIGDNADKKLQASAKLSRQLQEARQKEMESKAKEQAEEIRKAEHLNKIMGCVGKILGGIIMAVSIVGAVFTGGASLALAAVGMALLIADPIVAKVTGKSITDRVMAPVLEHVIQPIMKFVAEKIKSFLNDLGVKDGIANIISTVTAAITVAVIMIAVGVVAKNVASALLKRIVPIMSKVINKVIQKTVPAAVRRTASKVSTSMSKSVARLGEQLGFKNDVVSLRSYGRNIDYAVMGAEVSKSTVETANSIQLGISTKKVADKEADIIVAMADVKFISKYLKQMIEIIDADNRAKLNIIETVSSINLARQQTNLSIVNLQRI
ncbi:type III secretion system translocon subunit SctE [Rouxiella badensis]|uniref:type III secretion system translocon subunit SctE n=1 Tax=Rouxiella badensis TaxID=1646377 RepID=UPI001787DA2F|nr:type III secretion system translocon subunit SctE [Rouxiella badensis]QOI54562.1 type III secretion system translocon subunit SctE [Rouxiella badensis subsp. acadiensis]